MIIDTTILVDLFRNNQQAKRFLLKEQDLQMSRISMMELVFGSPSKNKLSLIQKQISALNIEIVEINETVSLLAGKIFDNYFHTTGIGILDAFIAATATTSGSSLATHNLRHFQKIKDLKVFKPY